MKKLFLIINFIITFSFPLTAAVMFAKTDNVKVFSVNNANSPIVKILKKNDSVNFTGMKNGKFFYVETSDKKKGWIFEFNLTNLNPLQKSKSGKLLDGFTTDNYASRDSSTKANVRGLTEISKEYAKTNKISQKNINIIEKMEKFKVSDAELDKFLKTGKLGEYGVSESE
ncbi:SH3 domain-containing protein [Candidatus Dependentiae bacterium]|nr:SH3 domain-containing protein [Candidatus Dependentiae bacterium]